MKINIINAIVVFIMTVGVHAQSLRNTKPNIVLVMTDDQGLVLGSLGHPVVKTPFIDKFAKKSSRFTNFYMSPNCAPSRAALMSGVHEFRAAVTATHNECERMALDLTTFPQLLQQQGYETGLFGKWHLGDSNAYLPQNRGFSEVLMHGAGGIGQRERGVKITSYADFPPNQGEGKKAKYFDPVLLHNNTIVQTKGYCTDIFFNAGLAWIKEQKENKKPFFAYISTNAPHSPLIAPKENLERMKKRGLKKPQPRLAMIENIDDNFGVMMEKLERWDMLDNTIVIFTSDNGAPGSDPDFIQGHKTGKGTPFEGGVHVPAFWYWKGKFKENVDIEALTAHIDLYQTFCELAGADIAMSKQELEGRSLLPLLENPNFKWEPRILQTQRGNIAKNPEDSSDKMWSVRTDRWRLVGKELYDLKNDPYEQKNVAKEYPFVVKELTKSHFDWYKTMIPYMINQNNVWTDPQAPFEKLYTDQKAAIGIPKWSPANTDEPERSNNKSLNWKVNSID
ncbi:arylsulfatase [Wenyingzhuangia aestuarii]|uniref:arylsulfatase n=1 Tax=Wenyingzhuangia aestuarii TaxID=1647582 RepID=UPI00143A6F08|nr:arylsulfatase [Wenyingzhuangia aestuarii]NJB83677.1 arylsulfatase [Wenyingzhuangia aestuarii]